MTQGYLLDTSVFLRFMDAPERLPDAVSAILADPAARVYVSAVSFFEIAVKKAMKKAQVPDNLPETVAETGLSILPMTPEDAWKTLRLPYHHTDPYDRLLLAQAATHGLAIVSACDYFDAYAVPVLKI
ncbi:MAG: type II toxin-antitoxin system VapC family toxin [Rhodospirillales bacterium]|nr:type II toxin-antitoxin system VapC family toxin [Alphaproteobacteria bacterium]MCB9986105.1 type II toxin-antitoxin system VapC family toxin [Rhodospirillales bacterium]USO07334.1 MAG: type II toxin-antitoxin system VapC family toxin [Rhodospirillales bacterium]